MDELLPHSGWYATRCVLRMRRRPRRGWRTYEERITLWRAGSFDEAIALAEAEAREYADGIGPGHLRHLGLVQAFRLFDAPEHGAEVFSLLRDSRLTPRRYLDRFFDTGRERQNAG